VTKLDIPKLRELLEKAKYGASSVNIKDTPFLPEAKEGRDLNNDP
jgi:hypothetical protein